MSLFTAPVKDYNARRASKPAGEAEGSATEGKKPQFGGSGGNVANSGAFDLRESIAHHKELLETQGTKSVDETNKTKIPKGFFEFV